MGKAPEVRHEAVNVNVGSSGPHGYSVGKALRWGCLDEVGTVAAAGARGRGQGPGLADRAGLP